MAINKEQGFKRLGILFCGFMFIYSIYLVTGTQTIASIAKYNKNLGKPLITMGDSKIYNPLKFKEWEKEYKQRYPKLFEKVGSNQSIAMMIGAIFLLAFAYKKPILDAYGTARFATENELKKEGYLSEMEANTKKDDGISYSDGIILSRTKGNKTIIDNGKTHTLIVAPTRSGKGVGTIIPTLLNWRESVFVTDIKGENYQLTGGWRKKLGHKVLRFAPLDWEDCVSYNPLGEIRIGTIHEFSDTQILCDILTSPEGNKEKDHWLLSASSFLSGVILHVLYVKRKQNKIASFSDIVDFLKNPDMPLDNSLELAKKYNHLKDNEIYLFKEIYSLPQEVRTHPKVANAMADTLNKADKERASVISTALAKLALFENPIIRKNTSSVEFKIKDLMDGNKEHKHNKPVSFYCVIPPNELGTLAPLIKMLVAQTIGGLTGEMDMTKEKQHDHRLLILLDEFNAFGKIEILEKALAFLAGYGIKVMMIVQSVNQLKASYGEKNQITDNCHCKMYYAPNDKDTPMEIAEMLGKTTVQIKNQSYKGMKLHGVNISEAQVGRDLMTAGEISVMDSKTSLIFFTGIPAYKAQKIRYYEEPYFKDKTKVPPLTHTEKIRNGDDFSFETEHLQTNIPNKYEEVKERDYILEKAEEEEDTWAKLE